MAYPYKSINIVDGERFNTLAEWFHSYSRSRLVGVCPLELLIKQSNLLSLLIQKKLLAEPLGAESHRFIMSGVAGRSYYYLL